MHTMKYRVVLAGMLSVATAMALSVAHAAEPPATPVTNDGIVMEVAAGLPDHTVYRPADLRAVRGRLPVVLFGNGGCMTGGNLFEPLLREVASHGYIVFAPGVLGVSGGAGFAAAGRVQNRTEQMFVALDWVLAENARHDSVLHRRIDTRAVAVMGQSCGGLQALEAAKDPRVHAVVILNSGIIRGALANPDGSTRVPAYLPASEADLQKLHTPVVYLIGGPTDIAYKNAELDFAAIERVPLFNANFPVGHGGTWREPRGGEMARPAIAWLDWQLKGDRRAGAMFVGADCGLCRDSRWTVKKKNLR